MKATVNVDGRITPAEDARVSVFDHGFLFGEGVYETLRTYNGQPFLFDRHAERLRASASRIALRVPLTDDVLLDQVRATIDALSPAGETYIRILLTRGAGEIVYEPAACPQPTVVIITKPFVPPPPSVYSNGMKVALVSIRRNHPAALDPLIKSNNLLNNALAMQEAYTRDADEALMLNHRGELAECSQSNFFLVRDGVALTPPLETGVLAGITRAFVMEMGASIGVEIREATLTPDDLPGADEAFVTSTTREVAPVTRIDDAIVGHGVPGPATLRLLEAYRLKAASLTAPVPSGANPR